MSVFHDQDFRVWMGAVGRRVVFIALGVVGLNLIVLLTVHGSQVALVVYSGIVMAGMMAAIVLYLLHRESTPPGRSRREITITLPTEPVKRVPGGGEADRVAVAVASQIHDGVQLVSIVDLVRQELDAR